MEMAHLASSIMVKLMSTHARILTATGTGSKHDDRLSEAESWPFAPPFTTHKPKQSHKPPSGNEERDTAEEDGGPPNTRCNSFAPFCSHCASESCSLGWHNEAHEKRNFDTPEYFEAYPDEHPRKRQEGPLDGPSDSEDDTVGGEFSRMESWFDLLIGTLDSPESSFDDEQGLPSEDLMMNALKCSTLDERCEQYPCACKLRQRCHLYDDIAGLSWTDLKKCIHPEEGHQKRHDDPSSITHDGGPSTGDSEDFQNAVKYAALRDACSSGKRPCACKLAGPLDKSDMDSIIFRVLNACLLGDGPHGDVDNVKLADDRSMRCYAAAQACSANQTGCGCQLLMQCFDESGSGPSWTATQSCYDSLYLEGVLNDLRNRDGTNADEESSRRCKRAEELCHEDSQCACHFSRRCQVEGSLSGHSLETMRRCLHAGSLNKPRNGPAPSQIFGGAPHQGDRTTFELFGYTAAISVSKVSPTVYVETGGKGDHGYTLVESVVKTKPYVAEITGVTDDQEIALTAVMGLDSPMMKRGVEEGDAAGNVNQATGSTSASGRSSSAIPASTSAAIAVLVGNNTAPYVQTTDAQGSPIYITKTGDWAASTTTLAFSESFRPATITRQGGIVEYRVITETRTIFGSHPCSPRKPYMLADKMVLDLGSTSVPLTGGLQEVNGTMMRVGPQAQRTLAPLFGNFNKAGAASGSYPPFTTLDKNNVCKYFNKSTVIEMNGETYQMTQATQTINGTPVVVDPLAQYKQYDVRFHHVAPTPACVGDKGIKGLVHRWIEKDCLVERCLYDFMRPMPINTVFPAAFNDDNCDEKTDWFTQKTWLHEPHWGTRHDGGTYYPAVLARSTTTKTKTSDGTVSIRIYPTCAAKQVFNDDYNSRHHLDDVQKLDCFDMESCYGFCKAAHKHDMSRVIKLALVIGLPLLFGLPLLLLLFCCLPWCLIHRRRRDRKNDANAVNNEKERRPSALDKFRRKSNAQNQTVVTGQATDPAIGRPVEGGPGVATAIVAGSAAGAAAAAAGSGKDDGKGGQGGTGASGAGGAGGAGGTGGAGSDGGASGAGAGAAASGAAAGKASGGSSNDDGKGTLGRQAEEGRSRVHFDEGAGGGEAPKAVSEGEPHVVAGPPKTDGTIESASGREWAAADAAGSVRGRKRNRPGLELAF